MGPSMTEGPPVGRLRTRPATTKGEPWHPALASMSTRPSTGQARDQALARVRRGTAVIGASAAAAAIGLGVLVAAETTTHSAPVPSRPPPRRPPRRRRTISPAATPSSSSSSSTGPLRPRRPPRRRRRFPRPRPRGRPPSRGNHEHHPGRDGSGRPGRTGPRRALDASHRHHGRGGRHRSRRGRPGPGNARRRPPGPGRGLQPVPPRLGAAAPRADQPGSAGGGQPSVVRGARSGLRGRRTNRRHRRPHHRLRSHRTGL